MFCVCVCVFVDVWVVWPSRRGPPSHHEHTCTGTPLNRNGQSHFRYLRIHFPTTLWLVGRRKRCVNPAIPISSYISLFLLMLRLSQCGCALPWNTTKTHFYLFIYFTVCSNGWMDVDVLVCVCDMKWTHKPPSRYNFLGVVKRNSVVVCEQWAYEKATLNNIEKYNAFKLIELGYRVVNATHPVALWSVGLGLYGWSARVCGTHYS